MTQSPEHHLTLPIPPASGHLVHSKYRPDIDGLRAIAVLLIVIYHAFPKLIPGGFIGVDVFFVISGYLISTIIIGSLEHRSFSFLSFYSRRIRRIFPALLFVLGLSLALGWFALLADEYSLLGRHVSGGAAFISNFMLMKADGYFEVASEKQPLLHLWSLGIEEQFYIVWPILLWLVSKARINLLTVTLLAAIASFALNVGAMPATVSAIFYAPQTRFWELMLGTILAYLTLHKHEQFSAFAQHASQRLSCIPCLKSQAPEKRIVHSLLSLTGASLLAGGAFFITKDMFFPGWRALIPTLGALLIISAGTHAWFNRTVLSSRALIWIGLISFPLYLWHWPLLVFTKMMEATAPSASLRASMVLLAVLFAWITYRWVERPLRFGNRSILKTLTLLALMLVVGLTGHHIYRHKGFESRVTSFEVLSRAAHEWQHPGTMTPLTFEGRTFYYKESARKTNTLFIGDSNIEQYYARADELIQTHPKTTNGVIFSTGGGCLAIPYVYSDILTACSGMMEKSIHLASKRKDITTVVLGGDWLGYFISHAGHYYFLKDGEKQFIETDDATYNAALKALGHGIQTLKKQGKRVVLMLNIPRDTSLDPKSLVHRSFLDFPHVLTLRNSVFTRQKLVESYGNVHADMVQLAKTIGVEAIDPLVFLCDGDGCSASLPDGMPIYKDQGHLSAFYVRNHATFIDSTLRP